MPWWGWITVAAILLAAEMTFVDLEFYLVFLGAAALIVGGLGLSGIELAPWLQWIVFAVLSIGSLFLFRQRLYTRLRPPPDHEISEGVDGERATATEDIAPNGTGPVTMRGTTWTGRNVGSTRIPAGASCRVERADGLTLQLTLD